MSTELFDEKKLNLKRLIDLVNFIQNLLEKGYAYTFVEVQYIEYQNSSFDILLELVLDFGNKKKYNLKCIKKICLLKGLFSNLFCFCVDNEFVPKFIKGIPKITDIKSIDKKR